MRFVINIRPQPKGRPRMTRRGICYTPAKTRIFEETFRMLALPYTPLDPMTCSVSVSLVFNFKKPRTSKLDYPSVDLDNLVKAALDALQGDIGIILNDKQVIYIEASKQWLKQDSIEVEISEYH